LQYARTEAQSKQGQAWYDAAVAADPVVPFFKVHRDINIHHRPVPMRTNITIHMPGPEITPPRTTSYTYEFKDWSGPEDLIGLCGRYLIRIEKIVEEGHALGLLTPDSAYSYRFWSSGK
jgi:hypothetical protein